MWARRAIAALTLAGALCLGLVGAAGAEPVRFRDADGDVLTVDPQTGAFSFSSPRLSEVISGNARVVQAGRRFSLVKGTPNYLLTASVDLAHLRASASVLRAKDRRLVFSMRDVTTSVPRSPTATPARQIDTWAVTGSGALARDPSKTFTIDLFRNFGQPTRGTFTYRDPAARMVLNLRRVDSFSVDARSARIAGSYTWEGRGDGQFVLTYDLRDDGMTVMSLRLAGGYRADDVVVNGRVKFSFRTQVQATASPTRTATRLPAYTPTKTPTPLPTSTPPPTPTPTRPMPTVPPH